eukprot:gene2834-58055_t
MANLAALAELSELPKLAQFLDNFFGPELPRLLPLREHVVSHVLRNGYLEKFFELHSQCEELGDMESLHHIWRIFRSFLLLNSTEMMKELLSMQHLKNVIGCFEYNPNRPKKKVNHREFLESAAFRDPLQVVPGLSERIRQEHMNNIFTTLGDEKVPEQQRSELLFFLEEMVLCAKSLPPQHRVDFLDRSRAAAPAGFPTLRGLFRVLTYYVTSDDRRVRQGTSDICWCISQMDVNHLRNFCLSDDEKSRGCLFLRMMFEQLIKEEVEGLQS